MRKNLKEKLVLLGAWNEPPLVGWDWFNERAMAHFIKLTGIRMRCLTFLKNGLHYQYFLLKDASKLFNKFKRLDDEKKLHFAKKIFKDYHKQAVRVKKFLNFLKQTDFQPLSNNDLIKIIEEWIKKTPLVTMQIWFAVLLDIWYPDIKSIIKIKKIAVKARDEGILSQMEQIEIKLWICIISIRFRQKLR